MRHKERERERGRVVLADDTAFKAHPCKSDKQIKPLKAEKAKQ